MTVKDQRATLRRERDRELEHMAAESLKNSEQAMTAISTHEKLCAERYKSIHRDIYILGIVIAAAASGLIGTMWQVIQKLGNL